MALTIRSVVDVKDPAKAARRRRRAKARRARTAGTRWAIHRQRKAEALNLRTRSEILKRPRRTDPTLSAETLIAISILARAIRELR